MYNSPQNIHKYFNIKDLFSSRMLGINTPVSSVEQDSEEVIIRDIITQNTIDHPEVDGFVENPLLAVMDFTDELCEKLVKPVSSTDFLNIHHEVLQNFAMKLAKNYAIYAIKNKEESFVFSSEVDIANISRYSSSDKKYFELTYSIEKYFFNMINKEVMKILLNLNILNTEYKKLNGVYEVDIDGNIVLAKQENGNIYKVGNIVEYSRMAPSGKEIKGQAAIQEIYCDNGNNEIEIRLFPENIPAMIRFQDLGMNLSLLGITSVHNVNQIISSTSQSIKAVKGSLYLNGLTSLTDEQAESLSNHEGEFYLNSLTIITDA